jgi:threonine dehydratase
MQLRSTILMPVFTPAIKVRAVRALGAEVILHGVDFDSAAAECRRLSAESGRVIVHPYDDPHVIAGQGTVGMELLRQWSQPEPIDAVFVCVGGGGLIAGIASYIKALLPAVRIIGVEADDAAAVWSWLRSACSLTALQSAWWGRRRSVCASSWWTAW